MFLKIKFYFPVKIAAFERSNVYLQYVFYSGKKKRHTLKYEMAISLETYQIIWVGGGIGGNLFHDLPLARLGILRALTGVNSLFLYLLGDKAYAGEDAIITPVKGPTAALSQQEQQYNNNLSRLRIAVENVFGRFTHLACMTSPWRGSLAEHTVVFHVIAEMVNIDMELHPIRRE